MIKYKISVENRILSGNIILSALFMNKYSRIGKISFMKISHCDNIRVFDLAGWALPKPEAPNFMVENSNNFLIAGYVQYQEYRKPTEFKNGPCIAYPCGMTKIKDFFPIIENILNGSEVKVSPFDVPQLYLPGNPKGPHSTRNETR